MKKIKKQNSNLLGLRKKHFGKLFLAIVSLSIGAISATESRKEILLNNDSVEVVRLTYPVGTESGLHTHIHPNRVVYFVKGGKLELLPENISDKSQVIEVPNGKTLFLPSTTHNVRNIGNSEIVIVETEIKKN